MRITSAEFKSRYRKLIPSEHHMDFDLDVNDLLDTERESCAAMAADVAKILRDEEFGVAAYKVKQLAERIMAR